MYSSGQPHFAMAGASGNVGSILGAGLDLGFIDDEDMLWVSLLHAVRQMTDGWKKLRRSHKFHFGNTGEGLLSGGHDPV
jgi:hypothetical protein